MAYRPSNANNNFTNFNNPMQGVLTPTFGVPNPSTGVEGSYGTGTYPQTPIPAGFVPGGDRPRPDWQNNIVDNPHMQNNFWQNLLSAFGNASPQMGQPMQPNEEVFRVGTGPAFGGGAASPGWGPNAWGMQQVQQQLGS